MNHISLKQFELEITVGADGKQQVRSSFDASGAELSPCGRYRYRLWRAWATEGRSALIVGLNPSTADATEDDPTIRREVAFAKRWGCSVGETRAPEKAEREIRELREALEDARG